MEPHGTVTEPSENEFEMCKRTLGKKKKEKEEYDLYILSVSFILNRALHRNVSKVLINSHSRAIVLGVADYFVQFCPTNWKISYSHSFN